MDVYCTKVVGVGRRVLRDRVGLYPARYVLVVGEVEGFREEFEVVVFAHDEFLEARMSTLQVFGYWRLLRFRPGTRLVPPDPLSSSGY